MGGAAKPPRALSRLSCRQTGQAARCSSTAADISAGRRPKACSASSVRHWSQVIIKLLPRRALGGRNAISTTFFADVGFDGAQRGAEAVGDLLVTESFVVGKFHRFALADVEVGERGNDADAGFAMGG